MADDTGRVRLDTLVLVHRAVTFPGKWIAYCPEHDISVWGTSPENATERMNLTIYQIVVNAVLQKHTPWSRASWAPNHDN